jgi:hypothetical protein
MVCPTWGVRDVPLFSVDEALDAVSNDLNEGFGGIFEGIDRVRAVGVFAEEAVGADRVSVLAWEWPVRHVGSLQGTPATGRELTLRGLTVIDARDGELFSRYIDWLALYAELGALTIVRPPVDDRSAIPDNVPHPVPDS